jgi:signal transduction histidine kinase
MIDDHVQPRVSTSTQRASILVIDDDRCVSEAMAFALESCGYRTRVCSDAVEALDLLRSGELPDLILLDLVMPRMNGWEFRIVQRREPAWADVPLIVMSADGSAQAAAIDADAYLQKPVDREVLLSSVAQTLEDAEQKRALQRHAELERLSSLGLLAAGIAHEINNPLAFVVGNLELAQRHIRELELELEGLPQARVIALAKLMDQANAGAQRVVDVVRSVAAFSRPQSDARLQIDVTAVLESSIQLVHNELRHHARLERAYEALPPVLGNPAKLGQVFVNLLSNAIQAVSSAGGSGHVIQVSTRTSARGEAVISVSDTGPGIPSGLVPRIFDPFFSTKPVGRGMGLGLAICQRLVAELGGTIKVRNAPHRGASFTITLPPMRAAEQQEPAPMTTAEPRVFAARPRILIIDDEPMMCEMLATTLADDYEVITTVDAREALLRFEQGESFDVILCDLMMPNVSGMDVHAELSRSRPEQASRMVFMTGGTFTARARGFLDALTVGHLEKPFRPPDVLRIVEHVLTERGLTGQSQRLN